MGTHRIHDLETAINRIEESILWLRQMNDTRNTTCKDFGIDLVVHDRHYYRERIERLVPFLFALQTLRAVNDSHEVQVEFSRIMNDLADTGILILS